MKRLLIVLLVLCLWVTGLPVSGVAAHEPSPTPRPVEAADRANSWRFDNGQWLAAHALQPRYNAYHPNATLMGIDVSAWQGDIDWQAVKDDGVGFAILRCGYGMDQADQDDATFLYNAAQCERVGIPYGVYLYSYANSVERASSEADHVLRLLKGLTPSLPVYFDMEDASTLTDDEGKPTDLAAIAKTFCGKITDAGYPVGVYANLYWWNDLLTDPCFDGWYRWVAQYNVSCGYTGRFDLWQFSATGTVDGIRGNVDMNYLIGFPDDHKVSTDYGLVRLSGKTRYHTADAIADGVKTQLGTGQPDSIIVACGSAFPDALSGSYLAAVTKAPILLTNGKSDPDGDPSVGTVEWVQGYVSRNVKPGGTVYLLGGGAAVPETLEPGLTGYTVKRLSGRTRYDTNLAILNETGLGDKAVVIASGRGFADSLSVSAAGLPLMIVGDELTTEQLVMLACSSGQFLIVGGTGAVSESVEQQLRELGTVERLSGKDRYLTSVAVAERLFPEADTVVLAYGKNFPDGLCGGPLAYAIGAPLLLVDDTHTAAAAEYRTVHRVQRGVILGGSGAVSDAAAEAVFRGKS